MILKYIYTIFLGVLLATFVGVGIAAFYPAPKYPESSFRPMVVPADTTKTKISDETMSASEAARIDAQNRAAEQISKEFQGLSQKYNRDISIIALAFAVAILLVSLTVVKNLIYIADGVLLGGVLTLLYSIIRGFDTDDNMFRFMVVAAGLIIALILGYTKFIKPIQKTPNI